MPVRVPVSLRAGVVVVGDTRLSVPRPCVASITTPAVTATASRPDTKVTIMAVCFEARKRDLRSSSTEYVLPFARLNTISRGLCVEEASSAVTPVAVSGSSRTLVRLPAVRGVPPSASSFSASFVIPLPEDEADWSFSPEAVSTFW